MNPFTNLFLLLRALSLPNPLRLGSREASHKLEMSLVFSSLLLCLCNLSSAGVEGLCGPRGQVRAGCRAGGAGGERAREWSSPRGAAVPAPSGSSALTGHGYPLSLK